MSANNIIRQFLSYYWLVIKRCFEGAFLVADGFGLVFLLLSKNQPNIPITISLVVFIIIFLSSSFSVWHEEVRKRTKLQSKLDKIRDDIPKYEITTGAVETYSIENVITRYSNKLAAAEAKIPHESPVESSNSSIAALVKNMKLNVLPVSLAAETAEEEADRLSGHLTNLEDYQTKMKRTYKVPIFFESSRSDSNVEFEVEVTHGATLIVEDNYPISELPRTSKPSPYNMGVLPPNILANSIANANRLYPYSYAEESRAFSKITKINANRKYNVFDEDFYIETTESTATLKVTIHSEKLQKKQVIEVAVELKGATVEMLSHLNLTNA